MRKKFKVLLSLCSGLIFMLVIINSLVTNYEVSDSKLVVSNANKVINIIPTESKLSDTKIKDLQEYYNNPDIEGIISIDGLENFNYPVVKANDNDYYLNHNYYREYDKYGSIYTDYRVDLDNSKKILIYGHSSIKREVPFNMLENYEKKDYYKEHKYITLETKTNTYKYEIFSVYVETSDFTYMNMNFNSTNDWYLHILGLQEKSMYNTDIELTSNDDILIMQTCSTNSKYKDYSKKYLLIVSRRVK